MAPKEEAIALAKALVAAGAAVLDAHRPGWRAQVDVSILDMEDDTFCVLGQLYGTYGLGVVALCPSDADNCNKWAHDHGFLDRWDARADKRLQPAWKAEITNAVQRPYQVRRCCSAGALARGPGHFPS